MDYLEFLQADVLCLLHDYGEMTAEEINSILGSDEGDLESALLQLMFQGKVRDVGEEKYTAVDELNVKRLKKGHPTIF